MERHRGCLAGLIFRLAGSAKGSKPSLLVSSKAKLAMVLIGCVALGLVPGGWVRTAPAQSPGSGHGSQASLQSDDQDSSRSEMRPLIERYIVDRTALFRSYPGSISPMRHDRLKNLYSGWLDSLKKLNFDSMGLDGRVDYVLFRNHLEYEIRQLDIQASQSAEIEPLVPFQNTITGLDDSRRRIQPIKSSEVATVLSRMTLQIEDTQRKIEAGSRRAGSFMGSCRLHVCRLAPLQG